MPVVKHIPSVPPSALLTAPALPITQQGRGKASSFGQNPSKALSQAPESWSVVVPLSFPLQCACFVTRQIMSQMFMGTKDSRTVSVPIRIASWPFLWLPPALPWNSTQQLGLSNLSSAGSGGRGTVDSVGSHTLRAPWLPTPSPSTTRTPPEIPLLSYYSFTLFVYPSLVSAQLCQAGQLCRNCR